MVILMDDLNTLLKKPIYAALEAGKAILDVYATDFSVKHKEDNSPLTLADQKAHTIILSHLKSLGIPILSEEGREIPFEKRKNWGIFWVVDPLDGTKEFVNRNGEFTVNIAFVRSGKPVSGVIYVPVKDVLYFALQDLGSFKIENASVVMGRENTHSSMKEIIRLSRKLPIQEPPRNVFTIIGSRSHPSKELESFVNEMREKHKNVEFLSAGSSLKICLVAEGLAHVYPRLGPTMEWDTAAGQAIAENAGLSVLNHETNQPLRYNKENLINPWFVVEKN